jgi:diacylglycerol kinase family enzyme
MIPDTPFFIVLNASSGKRDTQTTEATIRGGLEQAGRRYDLARIDHPRYLPKLAERAVQLAQQQGAVVVAGGDGTINAVAQAALTSGLPFGVLPQGIFNYGCIPPLPLLVPACAITPSPADADEAVL